MRPTGGGLSLRGDLAYSATMRATIVSLGLLVQLLAAGALSLAHGPAHWVYLEPTAALDAEPFLARGARVRVVSRWLHALSIEADAATMEAIAALPQTRRIAPLGRGVRPRLSSSPAGRAWAGELGIAQAQLEQLAVPALHACGLKGQGLTIAVLDTGFSLKHQALAGVEVADRYDFVNDDAVVAEQSGDPPGQADHGTLVLALLAGNAPGAFSGAAPAARYLLAKVDNLSADLPIEDDWWVAGLEWAAAKGARVVSSSISFCTAPCDPQTMDGLSEATSKAAAMAAQKGVLLLNSAGNTGPSAGSLRAPGDAVGVLAVGGVDAGGALVGNSSRGPTADGRIKPDLVGPASGVYSVDPAASDGYRRYNGTSVATPLVAGIAALLAQAFPADTPLELIERLKASANHASSADSSYGWGLPQPLVALAGRCPQLGEEGAHDAGPAADLAPGDQGAADAAPREGGASADTGSAAASSGGCALARRRPTAGRAAYALLILVAVVALVLRKRQGAKKRRRKKHRKQTGAALPAGTDRREEEAAADPREDDLS